MTILNTRGTDNIIIFFVPGTPVSKGSYRAALINGKAVLITQSGSKIKAWTKKIKTAGKKHKPPEPFDCPLHVSLVFVLDKPKKPRFSEPAVKPDIDKLSRAVLDALEGDFFTNDSRVITLAATKTYKDDPLDTGVEIQINPI